jgi:hypothetical protein
MIYQIAFLYISEDVPSSSEQHIRPKHWQRVYCFLYCGIFAQSKKCGARQTAIAIKQL